MNGPIFDEQAARSWCEGLAAMSRREEIRRDGRPYLTRFYLAGWSPFTRRSGAAVFLHHFVASDAHTTVHSHPWGWSTSLILAGGYREERCQADGTRDVRDYKPGDVNELRPDDKHRIDLLGPDCWTLFLAGGYAQPWRFSEEC